MPHLRVSRDALDDSARAPASPMHPQVRASRHLHSRLRATRLVIRGGANSVFTEFSRSRASETSPSRCHANYIIAIIVLIINIDINIQ